MAEHEIACPVVCEELLRARNDIEVLGGKMRRVNAVLFGVEEDESGGMKAKLDAIEKRIDIAIVWARALVICTVGLMVILGIGPDRLQRLFGMVK